MLKHLTRQDIDAVIKAAETLNAAEPPSELGITLEEGREKLRRAAPYRDALSKIVSGLSDGARMELMALLWLGRGDSQGTFNDLVAHAQKNSNEGDVDYIVEKSPALPKYLKNGLKALA